MAYKTKYDYLENPQELNKEIINHKSNGSISEEMNVEIPLIRLNLRRAENELKNAEMIFKVSVNDIFKNELGLLKEDTFYSSVISHAYYAIFFATKALLLKEKVRTKSPNIHKATLDAFAYYLISNGKLDVKLLNIYKSAIVKADSLLGLFISEKDKRGTFTYQELSDANKEPAEESINNANQFLTSVIRLMQ